MPRFDGYVKEIVRGVDVLAMRDWVLPIPLTDWPEAPRPTLDPYIVGFPAVVNMLGWHGFEAQAVSMVLQLGSLNIPALRGKKLHEFMISTMVPGQFLGTHNHSVGDRHCFRVHVPIVTNPSAFFIMDRAYQMEVGCAYMVNVTRPHAVVNHGEDRRIHFMFEVEDV